MKILLLGKNGQVGWELQRSLMLLGELVALDRRGTDDLCGDASNPDSLVATVREVRPDVIVNAAAYTAVDRAEAEPDLAYTINATAPAVLAAEAAKLGAWLVHYSSDYVFDGSGIRPWQEESTARPLNVYGWSKLKGEEEIRASGCLHLIFRTSWVHSARGGNFARTILRLAEERETLNVIDDQYGAPTGAELLADCTASALHRASQSPSVSGTYHLTASGETTWHGYAVHVIERANRTQLPFRLTPDGIRAVPSSAFITQAQRPENSRLATAKFRETFGLVLPDWRIGVNRTLDELLVP
jgi:dTDP-4-dehydrorhamnose reductase